MIKVKFHSMVDVITNSSTVIYTYQNSVTEAKELVQEVLNLMGEDLTPDDVFYYGVFCDNDRYADYVEEETDEDEYEDFPKYTEGCDWEELGKEQKKWMDDLKLSIIKGDIKKPEWMSNVEDGGDYWDPDTYLYMLPKDKRFANLADKMSRLLNSVTVDGGRDG